MSPPTALDAVVAGGGPAGATAARRLAQAGFRVLLANASSPGEARVGEALPPAARPLLRDLGLWERFCGEGHLRCPGNDSAWGSPLIASTDFLNDPNGYGWHLDRPRFDAFLLAEAAAAGVEVRPGTALADVTRSTGGGWEVSLDDGTVVPCRWVVDATGRRCAVGRRAGARRRTLDAAVAVVGRLEARSSSASKDTLARTLVEAVPDGWWYCALVPGARQVAAFVSDRDLLPPSVRNPEAFRTLLGATQHIGLRLGDYVLAAPPRQVAAGSAVTDPPAGAGWVAVGDAAAAFDPLSSQGLFNALYTAMVAADAVQAELQGRPAVPGYVSWVRGIVDAYLHNLTGFYSAERRWPDRPFWRRRVAVFSPDTRDGARLVPGTRRGRGASLRT